MGTASNSILSRQGQRIVVLPLLGFGEVALIVVVDDFFRGVWPNKDMANYSDSSGTNMGP